MERVPDHVDIDVPPGARAVVVSDIHLGDVPTEAATRTTEALRRALTAIDGPGALVIAGDGFEMLACPPDIRAILDAHPDFVAAVRDFGSHPDHRVVLLPGNHDGQLAWDADADRVLAERLEVDTMAMSCDLVLHTGAGTRRVRVVHGNQDDPFNRFTDVRAPLDTPLGHHIVREVLPRVDPGPVPGALLEDIPWLNDTHQIPQFLGSRLLYRKLVGRLWIIAVPFAAAVLLRLVSFLPGVGDLLDVHASRWLIGLGIAAVFAALVGAAASAGTMLRVRRALADSGDAGIAGAAGHNAPARERAARLIADGYAGLITGHTHMPELAVVGDGFYANSGCGIRSVVARPTRFGLPATFVPVRRCSLVELDAGPALGVRLMLGDAPMRSTVLLERLVTREDRSRPVEPAVVAELPGGGTWPIADGRLGDWVGRRNVRRLAAGLLVLAGALDIASVFVRELRDLGIVDRVLPFTVHPVAGITAVLTGCALIGVARGVRLGRRRAWLAAIGLLVVAALAHLLKGGHVEEAVVGVLLAGWLLLQHKHFRVVPPARGRVLGAVATLVLFAITLTAGLGVAIGGDDSKLRPAIALAIGAVVVAATVGRRWRHPLAPTTEDRAAAAAVVARYGTSPFDELVLADGCCWLFSGETVVAYTVHSEVMTVWPDPVGPPAEHADAWADAMDHADTFGWSIAVRGASAVWLPVYQAAGLVDTYVDDALVIPVAAGDGAGSTSDGVEVETSEGDGTDRLTTTARNGSGATRTHHHVWSPTIDGWLLVHRECHGAESDGLDDAAIRQTLCWMRDHRGRALALGPVVAPLPHQDVERWALLPGVTALPRYAVDDSTRAGPGRR